MRWWWAVPMVMVAALMMVAAPAARAVLVDFDTNGSELDSRKVGGNSSKLFLITGKAGNGMGMMSGNFGNCAAYYAPQSGGGADYMLGEGSVEADLELEYYASADWGNAGPGEGLLVKGFDEGADGDPEGYVANLQVSGSDLVLKIGCHKFPGGSTPNGDFLRDGVNHSAPTGLTLMTLPDGRDNNYYNLGWWNVKADVSVVNGDDLQIDVFVTDPSGATHLASYTDTGNAAFTGDGQVGVTNQQLWSRGTNVDNFFVQPAGDGDRIPEPATLTLLGAGLAVAALRRRRRQ